MRLLELSVRNILGLKEAFIDFEPGAVAIVGPNGAGKSSILDSLVLALFGSTTPVRTVSNQNIIRIGASEGYVVCTFAKGDFKYKVTRKFKAPKGQQEALLEKYVEEDWTSLASTVREVNEGIAKVLSPFIGSIGETTLGRLRDAFISTVFVPQGMVTKFVDVSPGERWQILVASLGLESESKLQERVRKVVEDASAEIENIKVNLSQISDFLAKLPPFEGINEELRNLKDKLELLENEIASNEEAMKKREKLEELELRVAQLEMEREEASITSKRLYDNLRLYDAQQALKKLIAISKDYGDLRKEERQIKANINAIEEILKPKLNKIDLLRNSYRNLYIKIQKLNSTIVYRDVAYKCIDLSERLKKCEEEIKILNEDIEKNRKALDDALRLHQALIYQKLKKDLSEIICDHKRTARIMAVALEQIRSRLIDWIKQLAPDGIVDFDRFKGRGAVDLAKALISSDLGQAFSEWANAQNKSLVLLKEGRRLRREIDSLGNDIVVAELFNGEIETALNDLEEHIKMLEYKRQKLSGAFEKSSSDFQEIKAFLFQLKQKLNGHSPNDIIKACGQRENLLKEMEMIRNNGDALNLEINHLTERKHGMEVELAKIRWECESANKKLKEAASLFKTICMKYQLSHEDKRTLVHCPDLTPCRQVDVEKAQNHLEWLRGLLYRAQEELQCFRSEVSDNIPDSSVLLDRKRKLEVDKEALKDAMSKLKYDLRQRKELEKEMRSTRERYECLDQAYDVALKLQRYSDGKNFVRFLSDTILKELLGAVNESLSSKGFSLTAESGKLYAVVNGFKRDAASLSGGERAIVALLMLRHLANKVGFKQVLFIDEGLAMLDDENLEMMLDLFDDLGREAFVGVITHDSDFASLFPKRIEVEAGRIRLVKN